MITRIVSGPLVLFIIIHQFHPKLGNIFTTIDGISTIPLGDQCLTNAKFIIPTYHDAANLGYQTIHVTTWSVIVIPHYISAGIVLCVCPANEGRRYNVTSSLIGWAHTQNDPVSANHCSWCWSSQVECFEHLSLADKSRSDAIFDLIPSFCRLVPLGLK